MRYEVTGRYPSTGILIFNTDLFTDKYTYNNISIILKLATFLYLLLLVHRIYPIIPNWTKCSTYSVPALFIYLGIPGKLEALW